MFYEAGDPRCSLAGRRRPIFCQCLLAPLYAGRQCYKDGRCGSRRGCLWLELWIRRPSVREPKGGLERGTRSETDTETENTHPSQRRRRMGHPQRLGQESEERVEWYDSRGNAVNGGTMSANREKGWATRPTVIPEISRCTDQVSHRRVSGIRHNCKITTRSYYSVGQSARIQ